MAARDDSEPECWLCESGSNDASTGSSVFDVHNCKPFADAVAAATESDQVADGVCLSNHDGSRVTDGLLK